MTKIQSPSGNQGVKDINSKIHRVFGAGRGRLTSRLGLLLDGIKEALIILLLGALLGYAIAQPWVSESLIASLRAIGVIQR